MGVDLKGILTRHEKPLEEFRGKFAVDAFNALYQFLTIIRQPDGTPLMNRRREITSHLSGLFYRTCSLLEKDIVPIYVFDGEPSELKRTTIAKRALVKLEAEERMKKAKEEGRLEEAAMLAQRTARLTSKMVQDSKILLDALGLPWVQAPSEGEAQCAYMAQKAQVVATASQDFDALLFGTPKLVRNLTLSGRRKLPRRDAYTVIHPEEYDLAENLQSLKISREKLVWAGILIGTDFNEGVYGIGPKKALKVVTQCDSTADINAKLPQPIDFAPLEDLFLHPPHVDVPSEKLQKRRPDFAKVREIMVESNDFSPERVDASLEKAFKSADEKQSGLSQWF